MRRIAVMTSGGDASGMNAAIRSVVRVGIDLGLEVLGIRRGFLGLSEGQFELLDSRTVSGIIRQGGTILGTARSRFFRTEEGQQQALKHLRDRQVDGLVVIGGDGSLRGAQSLYHLGFPVMGVPATIDNDIPGTLMSIGVDTALNTALEAIDRIKDTASAHNRAFVVEVMGRDSGYLALMAAMASGAEMALVPEIDVPLEQVLGEMRSSYARGKTHFIVVVAEGARINAKDLADYIAQDGHEDRYEARLTVLGHVQRGGSPSAFDRILATRMGAASVERLSQGYSGEMVVLRDGDIWGIPLEEVLSTRRTLDPRLYGLSNVLAT